MDYYNFYTGREFEAYRFLGAMWRGYRLFPDFRTGRRQNIGDRGFFLLAGN